MLLTYQEERVNCNQNKAIVEHVSSTETDEGWSNHNMSVPTKRPRGRPRKKAPQNYDNQLALQPTPLSIEEANNTWNIAKLIGISSNNEDPVLSLSLIHI